MSTNKQIPSFYLVFFDENINAYNYRHHKNFRLDKDTGEVSIYDASGMGGGEVYTYPWEDWHFTEADAKYDVKTRNKELADARAVLEKIK